MKKVELNIIYYFYFYFFEEYFYLLFKNNFIYFKSSLNALRICKFLSKLYSISLIFLIT